MARSLIVLVVLAAACAEPAPPTLEVGSLEGGLPASIWPDDPALVSDVECPGLDVELIAQSVVCTATLDVDAVTVDVVVDESGAATAEIREPLFVVADAADQLVRRLEDDLAIDSLDAACNRTVVVAESGRALSCVATDGSGTIDFELVLGGDGDDWVLQPAS